MEKCINETRPFQRLKGEDTSTYVGTQRTKPTYVKLIYATTNKVHLFVDLRIHKSTLCSKRHIRPRGRVYLNYKEYLRVIKAIKEKKEVLFRSDIRYVKVWWYTWYGNETKITLNNEQQGFMTIT